MVRGAWLLLTFSPQVLLFSPPFARVPERLKQRQTMRFSLGLEGALEVRGSLQKADEVFSSEPLCLTRAAFLHR